MNTLQSLRPGDFMFGPIGGFIPGVMPVGIGQLALASRKERLTWKEWWKVRHVAVVVCAAGAGYPSSGQAPRIVQAMPSGAEEIPIGLEHWTDDFIYIRPYWSNGVTGEAVAMYARSYIGTPYSFADYAAIEAHHLHLPVPHLDRYIRDSGHMICSQLADQAAADAGYHIFDDGRFPGDVTPAALYRKMILMPHLNVGPVHYLFTGLK